MISKHSHQLQSRPPYCVSSYRHRCTELGLLPLLITIGGGGEGEMGRGRGGRGEERWKEGVREGGIEGERGGGGRRVKNVSVYISYRLLMELKLHSYGTWGCFC